MTINKLLTKRNAIIGAALVIVIAGAWFIAGRIQPAEKKIYEAAVVVRSQLNPNPVEDARSSLKAGDVLVVQGEGHGWSGTERISYLIVKLELTEEQARKLTAAKERELKEKELSPEERERREEEKKMMKEEGRDYEPEPRRETLLAREYRIKLEKIGFTDPNVLTGGQPFLDQVFDWGAVEKK